MRKKNFWSSHINTIKYEDESERKDKEGESIIIYTLA